MYSFHVYIMPPPYDPNATLREKKRSKATPTSSFKIIF